MQNKLITRSINVFTNEFGVPSRTTKKVNSWDIKNDFGVVIQIDQPSREQGAYIWLPLPKNEKLTPESAKKYTSKAGRHSNTYATAGLNKGHAALKLFIRTETELNECIKLVKEMTL